MSYAELNILSNFTFLKGAAHPEEYAERAADLGLSAFSICDENSFAGVVRAHIAAKAAGVRFVVGTRLVLEDGSTFLAFPQNRKAYGHLCRLLTLGKRRTTKGKCQLFLKDLTAHASENWLVILRADDHTIRQLHGVIPDSLALALCPEFDGQDQDRFAHTATRAHQLGLPLVATGNVIMHRAQRRMLADILSCLREKCTIDAIGTRALLNAERRLRSEFEIRRLYTNYPDAVKCTQDIVQSCTFSLDDLRYEYPAEVTDGLDPDVRLRNLTEAGLIERYPDGIPLKVRALVEKEMRLIKQMQYAPYFLTVYDVVKFARDQGILCQGRGSAANSVVCYALGVTSVSPDLITMVFERFVSEARNEPPDIDVDFEHERREEVIQYIYSRYGRSRAGLCATVIHFRNRAAIREVGKVMSLSQDAISGLSSQIWGWSDGGLKEERIAAAGLNLSDHRIALTLKLANELVGFPRHLSQHVGGFVMTEGRLDELCPIENAAMEDRTVIEWDKDDIDALGILKVDVLALGMLSALSKSFQYLRDWKGEDYTLASLPPEDPDVYDMLCEGRTVGLFQVESRAQMNFLPRMRPRTFRDLIIEVAIIRPGPIQGDMVHPYLKRRRGEEQITYPSKELEKVLERTLGVPLFQEQVMQVAVVAAGFTPSEADQLRRSVGTFRGAGDVARFKERFTEGALARGYSPEYAEKIFSMLEGFSGYGFPESHSASFALLVYASAWIKYHHPEVFTCALLNSLPMGFYAPSQIIQDAKRFGVEIRPLSIQHSYWDHMLEPDGKGGLALRLGFRQLKGFKEEDARWISAARGSGYRTIDDVWVRAGIPPAALERLAEADAFADFGIHRRTALWQASALKGASPPPLLENLEQPSSPVSLPAPTAAENVFEDYISTRLSLREHPLALLSHKLPPQRMRAHLQRDIPNGSSATVTGLVTTRQRPGTASGVIFLTLEDETGHINVIVWPKTFERFRPEVMTGRLLTVFGEVQREGIVTHLISRRIEDVSLLLDQLGDAEALGGHIEPTADGQDEAKRPVPDTRTNAPRPALKPVPRGAPARHPREQAKRLFASRDFH